MVRSVQPGGANPSRSPAPSYFGTACSTEGTGVKAHHPDLKVNTKSILLRLRGINRDTALSMGARVLLSQITLRAGARGVIWYHNETLARDIGESPRQMGRYLSELQKNGRIIKRTKGPYRYLCPYPDLEHGLIETAWPCHI